MLLPLEYRNFPYSIIGGDPIAPRHGYVNFDNGRPICEIVTDMVDMGCKLQASADFIAGGRLGAEKRPAIELLKQGLYTFIASDAHCVKHYQYLANALRKYGEYLA